MTAQRSEDRSDSFLMYLRILLERMGFRVVPLKKWTLLRELLPIIGPDLVLLSAPAEPLSPAEALAALRADPGGAQVPVVLILARGEEEPGFAELEALLLKYSGAGPRYTSYPTAPVWTEAFGPREFRAELGRRDVAPGDGLSVYVHVPFCEALCHYCACNKVITRNRELAADYLDTLAREVAAVREALAVPRPATQQHWGGGTPTYLTPEQLRRTFWRVWLPAIFC